ncbi:MAG: hypothetical protein Q9174_001801 [Haloplaca sp. 1 TL-2023]
MSEAERAGEQHHPNLQLSPDERRYFGQLFASADTDKIGVVTGEVAVKFFEKTRLPSATLGEIWQIADTENRGLLTPAGFGLVLRLIGYAQAGRSVSAELALKPGGPLPRFDGIPMPQSFNPGAAPLQAQNSGSIRIPPLNPDKIAQYSSMFESSGAQGGSLSGENAKQIFEKAQLPNEVLGQVWNLADTEGKGFFGLTDFIIAMHLLASLKSGAMRSLPQTLPAGLYEAASRRGIARQGTGSRPPSDYTPHPPAIPRQFSGASYQQPGSPVGRPSYNQGQRPMTPTGPQWAITPQDKASFDQMFGTVDTYNRGFITGEQAVSFFSNSRLPEEALAQIWDLADINSEGQLNKDEFAVAMYLIRQQRSKTTGRDVLPQKLPPNLVPPSMRQQQPPPAQPTAPTFDNAANITAPKSAAEDLFGLDAISSPASKAPESASDSSLYNVSPPRTTASPQVPQQPQQSQQSSVFKPFIPSSSFGQTIMTPQGTGTSASTPPSQARGAAQSSRSTPGDDLLGDNDPEVSKKLTNETSELANLSNQVSTLTGQMQEVKKQRPSTSQDLSRTQTSKRDFESRLAVLRSSYEQEVREVKAMEGQLATVRNECRKLQSDIAMVEGALQDLRNQRQQIASALETEQNESAGLKERLRQANASISESKPEMEKMKSDLRQQKGLVAINRKQLATIEAERDKLKIELEEARKEHADATREVEETTRALERKPTDRSQQDVTSPAPSTTSLNPFMRRPSAGPGSGSKGVTSPFTPANVASPSPNAFDSFFGPSAGAQPAAPPPTSFRTDSPSNTNTRESTFPNVTSGQSERSSDGPGFPTPSGSPPPSAYGSTPQAQTEPPAPPQSRQITSSFLPFGKALERSGSEGSSVRANPPASRMGEPSGSDTPTDRNVSFSDPSAQAMGQTPSRSSSLRPVEFGENGPASATSQDASMAGAPRSDDMFGQPSAARDMPGGFPSDTTPPLTPDGKKFGSSNDGYTPSSLRTEVPSNSNGRLNPAGSKEDFDAAFQGFGDSGSTMPKSEEGSARAFDGVGAPKAAGEFPPIQEFGADEESDSDNSSGRGFDDDFTAASPPRTQQTAEKTQTSQPIAPAFGDQAGSGLAPSRPPLTSGVSNTSQLPTPGAQMSPPTYDQTIASPESNLQSGQRKPSDRFPQEFTGLLPSRDDPTSPPPTSDTQSQPTVPVMNTEKSTNVFGNENPELSGQAGTTQSAGPGPSMQEPHAPMAPGASEATYAYQHQPTATSSSQPQLPPKNAFDDFDNEFGDLSEAKEADDKGDEEFTQSNRSGFDEFNPTFDSPASTRTFQPQQQQSSQQQQQSSFADFESSISSPPARSAQQQQQPPTTSHDWDAIFAGLDTPSQQQQPNTGAGVGLGAGKMNQGENRPATLARGLSEGTEHDDPIVKDMTSMGFKRDECVSALESFDYNSDKAVEYLASRHRG